MKKILSVIALVAICYAPTYAGTSTTTTTTTVIGKNTGSSTTNGSVTINCDNFWSWTCYTVTTVTVTETAPIIINHGDPITVTVFDANGENPQIALQGSFDYVDTENNGGTQSTATFAIILE